LFAETRLHEATAQTGVAVASFYPDLTLNGAVGLESLYLANLFSPTSGQDGRSQTWPMMQIARRDRKLDRQEAPERQSCELWYAGIA